VKMIEEDRVLGPTFVHNDAVRAISGMTGVRRVGDRRVSRYCGVSA
jgi:hypothetical protein